MAVMQVRRESGSLVDEADVRGQAAGSDVSSAAWGIADHERALERKGCVDKVI